MLSDILLRITGIDSPASLGVQRFDDDRRSLQFSPKGHRILHGSYRAVREARNSRFLHHVSHPRLVGKKKSRLVTDSRQSHLFRHVSHGANGDICLIRNDSVNFLFSAEVQRCFLISHIDEVALLDVGFKCFVYYRCNQHHVVFF